MECQDCGSTCHTTVTNTVTAQVLCCNCDMGGCPERSQS